MHTYIIIFKKCLNAQCNFPRLEWKNLGNYLSKSQISPPAPPFLPFLPFLSCFSSLTKLCFQAHTITLDTTLAGKTKRVLTRMEQT